MERKGERYQCVIASHKSGLQSRNVPCQEIEHETLQFAGDTSVCRVALNLLIHTNQGNLFIFRQKGREGEREGEKHQCVVASFTPPFGDLVCNPGMCPDWELNW